MKAIKFTNFSDTDFTWAYDNIEYTFPAKSEMFLEEYKAEHFANHLIDRELNALDIPTNTQVERQRMWNLCFPSLEEVTPSEALNIEAKKKTTKKAKVTEEVAEEFNDE